MKKLHQYLLIALLSACSPAVKMSVTHVNDVNRIDKSSCFYALPLSGFAVSVVVKQESFIPGPYCRYAGKYLGITDVIMEPYEKWSLTDIYSSLYTEADPDFLFSVNDSKIFQVLQELDRDSLILLPVHFATRHVFHNQPDQPPERFSFSDLSVKRNFEADKDIVISETLPDSSYAELPVAGNIHTPVVKTTEQKAEEAANFIIKIRKRRFKLISGQYDFMPDGESLGRAVDELNCIEADYISLFVGIKTRSTHTRTFQFIPASNPEIARTILCRFSETLGLMDSGADSGKPVLIDIRDMNKTKGLDALKLNLNGSENQLFYRIPDQAFIRILFGEQVMEEALFPVFQFGTLVPVSLP